MRWIRPWAGTISFEHSIGVSVRATTPEKKIEAASVMPNSRKSLPVLPVMKASGTNTAIRVAVVAITAKPISRAPSKEASSGGWPFLDAPVHVLDLDDGVVHHDADGEHDGEQRQHVDRCAEEGHHHEGRRDGDRDRHHGHDGGAPVAQEDQDDEDHQRHAFHEGVQHAVDGGADELALVIGDLGRGAGRKRGLELLQLLAHAIDDGERVGGRLAHDAHADGGLARLVEFEARILRPDLDSGDLAEAHEIAALVGDDHLRELLGRGEAGIGLDGEFALRGLDPAAGQLDVLALDGGFEILHRQAAGGERRAVDPDAHGEAPFAAQVDVGDAGNGGQAVHIDALEVVAEFERIEGGGGDADPHDGRGVRIDLAHHRRIGAVRQAPGDAGHGVAHVRGRGFRIAGDLELDGDRGAVVLALGRDLADALDAGDRALDDLRHPALDHLVRGAAIDGGDRDDRAVDLRIFANRQVHERGKATHDQQQADHDGEDGAADEEV